MNLRALMIAALLGGPQAACALGQIANPSFENSPAGLMPNGNPANPPLWGMPSDWTWRRNGAANGRSDRNTGLGFSTHGEWSLYVFASTEGPHNVGDYLEFYQSVDLTGITEILFDARLRGGSFTDSVFFIDGAPVWEENAAGTYLDVSVDTSGYSGLHDIGVGVRVFQAFGSSADGWTHFDNLRAIPEPATLCLLVLGGLALRRR